MFILNDWPTIRRARRLRRLNPALSEFERNEARKEYRRLHWLRAARIARLTLERHKLDETLRMYRDPETGTETPLFV